MLGQQAYISSCGISQPELVAAEITRFCRCDQRGGLLEYMCIRDRRSHTIRDTLGCWARHAVRVFTHVGAPRVSTVLNGYTGMPSKNMFLLPLFYWGPCKNIVFLDIGARVWRHCPKKAIVRRA